MEGKSPVSMEKSKISSRISMIPEEIIVEILRRRLPLESLHRFKWVSRSWCSLITSEIFPKTLSAQFIGFLCRHRRGTSFHYVSTTGGGDDDGNTAIDTEPLFLPPRCRGVLDCCNGLVLSCYDICDAPTSYVVCNPFTKSWTRLPLPDYMGRHRRTLIDFDPSISPHYKVVAVWEKANAVFIKLYRSEAGRWEQKRVNLGDCLLVACRGWALWDGDLYVHTHRITSGAALTDGAWYETVRFGLSGGDDDFELIKFPMGTEEPYHHREMHIGRRLWDGRLCSAHLDGGGLRLRAWTMTGVKRNKKWVLEHDSTIRGLSGWHVGLTPPVVVGFHPVREAVLIRFKHVIFGYHLQEMSLFEISRIGKDGDTFIDLSLFPFLPCSYDFLESRNGA